MKLDVVLVLMLITLGVDVDVDVMHDVNSMWMLALTFVNLDVGVIAM